MNVPITNLSEERAAYERQQAKWQGFVKDLAEEFSRPMCEVEQLLTAAAQQIAQAAHIKDFVPLLAIKQVKDLLRPYRHTLQEHQQRALNHPQSNHHHLDP